ncbi:hypothetical protein AGDE_16673 [Angomonas deanei]|nr:hypothetical protein AGDE_16673 [Angomonas deanei]|eukprot:EPY16655.1 hypothetical protein AGDE_16673 [Angomonas deanei]
MLMGYASASSNGGESPGSPTQALQGTTPASYKISIGSASSGNAETHNNNTNSAIIPHPTFPEEEKELKSICVSVLQLLTALAFNCPCTPLSTAAQLLLSRAITTALQQSNDNPNKNEKVWERIPFLALLPRLTGQSEVLQTFAPVTATHSAVPPLRGKDTLLLLDTHGTARVTSIQQWQQEQTAGGGSTVLVLGPQPATTVLFLYERTLFNAAYASRDSERLLHCLQLAEEESKQYWSILPSPLLQARSDYHSTAHPPVLLWGGQQGAVSHPNRQRRPMAEIPGLGQEQQTQKYMQTKQLQRQHALPVCLGEVPPGPRPPPPPPGAGYLVRHLHRPRRGPPLLSIVSPLPGRPAGTPQRDAVLIFWRRPSRCRGPSDGGDYGRRPSPL